MTRAARLGLLAGVAVLAGCGTSGVGLDDPAEPSVTLFADEAEPTESATTADREAEARTGPSERGSVPEPVAGAPGIVFRAGVALPVVATDASGWTAALPCGGELVAEAPAPSTVVVIADPGGDVSSDPDEVAVAASITAALAVELDAVDVSTAVTRPGTADLSIGHRLDAAAASGALLLVSVIVGGQPEAGFEVVHRGADAEGRRLAGLVFEATERELDAADIAVGVDAGVRSVLNQRGSDYYAALRAESFVAVVVRLPVPPDGVAALAGVGPRVGRAIAAGVYDHLTTEAVAAVGDPEEVVRDAPTAAAVECVDPTAGG